MVRDNLNDIIDSIKENRILESFEKYYHDDVVMYEKGNCTNRVGKEQNRIAEQWFVDNAVINEVKLTKMMVDGLNSAYEMYMDITEGGVNSKNTQWAIQECGGIQVKRCAIENCVDTGMVNFKCYDCTLYYCYIHKEQDKHKCLEIVKNNAKNNEKTKIDTTTGEKKRKKLSDLEKENKKQEDQLREFRNAQRQKFNNYEQSQSIIKIQQLDGNTISYKLSPKDHFKYIRDYINFNRTDGYNGPYSISSSTNQAPFTNEDLLLTVEDLMIDSATLLIINRIDKSNINFDRINMQVQSVLQSKESPSPSSTSPSYQNKIESTKKIKSITTKLIILDLSFLLIKEIFKKLSILDFICFSLTCRKLFLEREKYMIFNPSKLVVREIDKIESFCMHSYRNIFEKSISLRIPNSMILYQNKNDIESDLFEYDYMDFIEGNENFSIPNGLELLYIDEFGTLENIPGLNRSHLKSILNGGIFVSPSIAGVLPETLQVIEFGDCFNLPLIPGSLPNSLKKVYLGDEFNQPIEIGTFPNGIETIIFGSYFNQPLQPGIFPESLGFLVFGIYFNQRIEVNVLPPKLEKLRFAHSYNHFPEYLPPSLVSLTLSNRSVLPEVLPNCLFSNHLTSLCKIPFQLLHLVPSSVKKLSFSSSLAAIELNESSIPRHIEDLNFYSLALHNLRPGIISNSVTKLNLGLFYDYALEPGVIPLSVKTLHLGFRFNKPLKPGDIPESVEELHFGESNLLPIERMVLPDSLKVLDLGSRYNCVIERDVLPRKLRTLKFGLNYEHPINCQTLPPTLQDIYFSHKYSSKIAKDAFIINNKSSSSNEIASPRITLHVGISLFLNNSLEDLPESIQSIVFEYKSMRFNIRRINDHIFLDLGNLT
ncbi:hypothetical protein PPL_12560 [Heterostelium album PN500]|uniref:UBX domain-containing protein n=1 Tax=Heterostelium pallidum (strain ATCC 26659 / Pp 5 / PN500) TaxID=670386 RepID=D3BMY6_HETP5|nr:hypothetical protein PPL_12560 [Heterostelium album PN500]EFA77348.1 hypothetical protein PPL_12560 [Heterostelium album PN500]|eukprot:XP_020429477.1 hypothetical protein PPL_12560 [Heterostelium album PN500]